MSNQSISYDIYSTKYWSGGKLHREDGPAVEFPNGNKEWFIYGKRHREDGPAIERSNESYYFLIGIPYQTKESWFKALTIKQQYNYLWNL